METATRKSKKVDKRDSFREVFERQARRFSAFDLLGLTPSPLPLSPPEPVNTREEESKEQDRERESERLAQAVAKQRLISLPYSVPQTPRVDPAQRTDRGKIEEYPLTDHDTKQLLRREREYPHNDLYPSSADQIPSGKSQGPKANRPISPEISDSQTQVLRTDGLSPDLGTIGPSTLRSDPSEGQTVPSKCLGQTVCFDLGQTGSSLGQTHEAEIPPLLRTDPLYVEPAPEQDAILLAPLQWQVWQLLQTLTTTQATISYREIAQQTKSTIEGVRKAIGILQKEGGITAKEVVRRADEQGMRFTLNPQARFRRGTLNEAKGILKRGLRLGRTPLRPSQDLGTDGLCMYVCSSKNINIRQTDIVKLLRIAPVEWKIREQTLRQIAEALPNMTALEFRLSLAYLVEQAKAGKEPIRHPNAWIKATFEKNGGPLVTEREIETRFSHPAPKSERSQRHALEQEMSQELELMRRYLACTPEDRSYIDNLATKMAAPLLKIVSEDKRAGVLEEARISALKEFFSKRGKPQR